MKSLQAQYEWKNKEADSLKVCDTDWFAKNLQLKIEANNIYSQVVTLQSEKFQIDHKDYTLYYHLLEPITYNILYYIGAGEFGLSSLISLIYFIVTRKK